MRALLEPTDGASNTTLVTSSSLSSSSHSLSGVQQIALALAPIPTALLSIGSSLLIINHVMRQNKQRNSFHRILLAMSIFDIVYSITACLQMFLMPSDTSPRQIAIGNDATCTASGFFLQLSFVTYWYNGILSLYYTTTIVYGWSQEGFAKVEPFLHGTCIVFSLITATLGVVNGWYSEMDIGFGCWVNDFPRGCERLSEDGITMGEPCRSDDIGWFIAAIPISLMFFGVILANIRIYCYVRSTIAKSRRHDFTRSASTSSIGTMASGTNRRIVPSRASSNAQVRRVRQVALQGFMYVGAFWITGIFNALVRLVEAYDLASQESQVYPLLFLQAVLSPSTGFINMLVYFRPRYVRCRQEFPHESRRWALCRAVWGQQIRPQTSLLMESRRPGLSRHRQGVSSRWGRQQQQHQQHHRQQQQQQQETTTSQVTFEEPPVTTHQSSEGFDDEQQEHHHQQQQQSTEHEKGNLSFDQTACNNTDLVKQDG